MLGWSVGWNLAPGSRDVPGRVLAAVMGTGERGPSRVTRGGRELLDGFGGILFADEHL